MPRNVLLILSDEFRPDCLPGGRWEIVLFHYALDGLILDQLTVPIDEQVDADHAVDVLVDRLLR